MKMGALYRDERMPTKTSHLDVSGMSCATCSATIEESVEELAGVTAASANFATDEATVEYDPEIASLAEVYDAIEAAGYEPERATATVGIGGMHCASCVEANERAIESVPGVLRAEVNLATDEATVEYNPADAGLAAVHDAVEEAGYEPVREDAAADGERESIADREVRKQRRLVIGGGVVAAPFALVMLDMFAPGVLPETLLGFEFLLATDLVREFY